tara:strand:- start:72 stop:434 length:363 start_codon:yes stop_codon:yes gene_type:complete
MSEKISLDIGSWKLKLEERKRNRMKLTIKFNKEESESYKSFAETVKPNGVSDDQFVRTIFYMGIQELNDQLTEKVQEYAETHKEELEASGIHIPDLSGVTAVSAEPAGVEIVEFDDTEEE